MYINTFKYSPQDVSCQLCTEYVKKVGCTALRCPWLAERIEAGVVGYRETIMETFSYDRRLFCRFKLLIKHISWRRCSTPFPPSTTTTPCWSITIFTAACKGRYFHARNGRKDLDTDETPYCLHHRPLGRERI